MICIFWRGPKEKEKSGDFCLVCGNSNKIAQTLENSPKFQNHKIENKSLNYHHSVFFFQISHVTPKVVRSHEGV
jgi:hypothetical protein